MSQNGTRSIKRSTLAPPCHRNRAAGPSTRVTGFPGFFAWDMGEYAIDDFIVYGPIEPEPDTSPDA